MLGRWYEPIDVDALVDREIKIAFLGVQLPSEASAKDFAEQKDGSLIRLILHFLGRSVFVGAGVALAGAPLEKVPKLALIGTIPLEVVILLGAFLHKDPFPTGDNATEVLEKKPGALGKMLVFTIVRAVFIATGLGLAGIRGKDLVKYSAAGSVAVQAFVLFYAWLDKRNQ